MPTPAEKVRNRNFVKAGEEHRFQPGQSGNPDGRPKKVRQIEDIAQESAEVALKKLVKLMNSKDERVALSAAQAVLDRGVGKPKQTIANEVTRKRDVTDIGDDELASIATSGSTGAVAQEDGETRLN